jgi:hypothetical protein
MTASAFKTNISIENIRTDGITAYVYLHFLSPAPSETNRAYRFYTEYIDQGSTFFWTDQVRYWIDRYSITDTDFSTDVSIRRNKVVVLSFDLSQGRLVDNRFVLNIKLHLKEEQLAISKDPTVWNSGVLTLSSREFSSPEIRCLYINNVDQTLHGKFKIKYKSSADKAIIENNATFYVEIYSPNRLLKREKVDLLTSSVSDLNYIEFSTGEEEIYEERISKIELTILLGDGQRLTSRTFVLDTLKNYTAYLAGPRGFTRILNFLVRVNNSTYLVKNIHKPS